MIAVELAKKRRKYLTYGVAPLVIATAGVIGITIQNNRSSGPTLAPLGAAADGKSIAVGAATAPATLDIFEDFRCPACQGAEARLGEAFQKLVQAGQLRINYHTAALIDAGHGGNGSKRAANAAACAQDQNKFGQYHAVLFSKQPPENEDGFGDRKTLLKLADEVPGLHTPVFEECVKNGVHDGWVRDVTQDFHDRKFVGTPTMLLNGDKLDPTVTSGPLSSSDAFAAAVAEVIPKNSSSPQNAPNAAQSAATSPSSAASAHAGSSEHTPVG
ncbi:thioredoxin domain-containing protein [Kitasatospora sp. NPDC086791]|uniref:DsbA family protein n=1 Tax=Kitasatospora sp. NPDC086791 TaxID=3155178 RepID=UPI0034432177